MEYYRRKQSHIAVRHVSGDSLVAVVEVVSPGNKGSRTGLQSFVEKVAEFLERRIHLLILDVLPPTPRDPQGIHGAIWEEFTGHEYEVPAGEPLTLAAYESAIEVRAYVEPLQVGSILLLHAALPRAGRLCACAAGADLYRSLCRYAATLARGAGGNVAVGGVNAGVLTPSAKALRKGQRRMGFVGFLIPRRTRARRSLPASPCGTPVHQIRCGHLLRFQSLTAGARSGILHHAVFHFFKNRWPEGDIPARHCFRVDTAQFFA